MCQCRQPEIKAPRCALESPRIQVPGVDSLRVKLDAHGSVWLVLTDADGAVSLVPVSMRAVAA